MDRGAPLLHNDLHGAEGIAPSGEVRLDEPTQTGWFIVQHQRKSVPETLQHFTLERQKRAGESLLSFFKPLNLESTSAGQVNPVQAELEQQSGLPIAS